jgi:kynurenine formamidase
MTAEAGDWTVKQGVVLVGLDFQAGKPGDGAFPVYNILLKNEVYFLEYIVNVYELPKEFTMVVAPLKLKGMEASTCRAFAVIND